MPTCKIEMLDRCLKETGHLVNCSPMAMTSVTIAGQQVIPGQYALVDTGCEYTSINCRLVTHAGLPKVDKTNLTDPVLKMETADIYLATIEIDGLADPRDIYVVAKDTKRHSLLLGRNILRYYRLVFDPPANLYELSSP